MVDGQIDADSGPDVIVSGACGLSPSQATFWKPVLPHGDLSSPRPVCLVTNSSTSHTPVINRRDRGDRITTMRLATIRLDDGEEIPCVLRDLSQTGAKLAVSRRYRLPATFYLVVHGREVAFPVRRAWQRGDFAGVMLAAASPSEARRPGT